MCECFDMTDDVGFGRAIVEAFLEHGARVAIMDLSFEQDGFWEGSDFSNKALQIKANVCLLEDWTNMVGLMTCTQIS